MLTGSPLGWQPLEGNPPVCFVRCSFSKAHSSVWHAVGFVNQLRWEQATFGYNFEALAGQGALLLRLAAPVFSRPLPQAPDPSIYQCLLFLLVSTRMGDRVFPQHLLAEKANIQKYFDNDILQFPKAV